MMSHKVYAPNIHLFAFHSSNESIHHSSLSKDLDDEILWKKCDEIFVKFKIEQQLKVRKISDGLRVALLEGATDNMISLPLTGHIVHEERNHRLTGFACPLKIENNYALALNLRIPELDEKGQRTKELELAFFKNLNQDNCFLPQNINSSIGQTVLLTGWLSQRQQPNKRLWREIADECVQNFLGKELEQCPPFYQSGQLFGSPIFEYGNPYQPHIDGQIVVWLFVREVFNGKVDSKIDNNFGFFYQKMIDLLYYRQRIIKAYQLALSRRERTLEETLRANEIAAQKREKKLQIWLAIVVICLAVSSISSQVSSPVKTVLNYLKPEQPLESPLASFIHFFFYNFYDVLLQTLVGLVIALLLGLVVWLIPTQSNQSSHSKD
jgi:hypothetical protein